MQSVNKRYSICQKPTQEDLCETLFAGHISLQRRKIGCKGTENLRDVQEKVPIGAIFLGKLKSENGKRGSEDDNRDNNPVAPTLCHGKEDEATKFCTTKIIGEPYTATSYCNGEWNE